MGKPRFALNPVFRLSFSVNQGGWLVPPLMTHHLIWAAGLLGHLLLLIVLFRGGRAQRFPCFTLLIFFNIVRSLALVLVLGHLAAPALRTAVVAFEVSDLLLEFGVLTELVLHALSPLGRLRRATLPLLLFASAAIMVTRVAPVSHYTGRAAPLLLHFFLGVLFLEWSLILAFLLRSLRLRWRSDVAAISFGYGLYSAVLLFAGGYFRVGRDMSDYIFFAYLRIAVYLLVVLWWIVSLWSTGHISNSERAPSAER
jgi:hypothetical protein